jgi:hypothetical protein
MRLIPLIGKFRRVVENQNLASYLRCSIARCLKMARQNGFFVDALIGKKAVSRLCIGPVLAHEGDGLPHSTSNLSKQLSEPLEEPRVLKLTPGELSVNPGIRLKHAFTSSGSPYQWRQLSHCAAPYRQAKTPLTVSGFRVCALCSRNELRNPKLRGHCSKNMSTPAANQVLNNESQTILADQAVTEMPESVAHESTS